ncbi:MAG: ATP-binding protein [Deltaproteobacteria bacterium]
MAEKHCNNLVGNAAKFTQAGKIRVAARIRQRAQVEVDMEILLRDTGIGMTEEEVSRLFKGFTRADDSTTPRYGATDMGLSISRNLVELMGGHAPAGERHW